VHERLSQIEHDQNGPTSAFDGPYLFLKSGIPFFLPNQVFSSQYIAVKIGGSAM
jgi:hypothetical protein